MQDSTQAFPGPQSSSDQQSRTHPARFLDHMQQLFGDDPDPVFLQESWTMGVPAATENFYRRRSEQAARNPEAFNDDPALRELDRMMGLSDDRTVAGHVAAFLQDRAQPIDSRYAPPWLRLVTYAAVEETSAPAAANREETCAEPQTFGMTTMQAIELLGIHPAATREEIRSAYRRMVIQCHPDRCLDASDAVRRQATQQMTDLNQAYRMLCEDLLNQAA